MRAGLFALAILSIAGCAVDSPEPNSVAEQAVITPPLPTNLSLVLNAQTSVTVGPFTQVFGDVASSGLNGSVLFDVAASQGFGGFNVLANTVTVSTQAFVGSVFGNSLAIAGSAQQQILGLDPGALPQVAGASPATPGTTNVSTNTNQAKQLCPGQYGAISLGANSTLNLNGGVYHVTRLSLAEGARLEPSEPVVILVSGELTTGTEARIRPSAQSINPMTSADIRIEVGGDAALGDRNEVRAHLLVTGRFSAGTGLSMTGAAWATTIEIGASGQISNDRAFSAQAPSVPPPCNDNNGCTADTCVGSGTTTAFCRNTIVPAGTSCADGSVCNGDERCNATGQCQPGIAAPAGTSCTDGDACNGEETCNGFSSCLRGTPPVVDDTNTCTADVCDAEAGVIHTPLPDGTRCNGTGVCTAGTCEGGTTSGSFSYSATNTSSATINTVNFDIVLGAGQTVSIGTCSVEGASGNGDTYLRVVDPFGNEIASNDDFCGVLSFLVFTAQTTGTYQVRAGCFSSGSCNGTVAFTATAF